MGDMITETKECSPSTWCGIEASVNCLERASLCSMLVVPRSTGCPVLCMQAISSTVACHLPFTVLKTTSDSTCPSGSHQSVTKQIPLFLWTSSHTSIWVHGSTQPLKSRWRSWSITINFFCFIFMQIPHSDLPSCHHYVSEALHSYTANRMMVHAIKMQDRNVYLPNNHQLVGWTYDASLLATHIVDNFSRKSPWLW